MISFAVASLSPREINNTPLIFINHLETELFDLNFLLIDEAKMATIKHQIVPVVMNTKPRIMNERTLSGLSGEINCGRKAIKNTATFGLKILVNAPCR